MKDSGSVRLDCKALARGLALLTVNRIDKAVRYLDSYYKGKVAYIRYINLTYNLVYKQAAHLSKRRTFSSATHASRRSAALQQIPILYVIE
jgi:hypothetical protein